MWHEFSEEKPTKEGRYLTVTKILNNYFYDICYWANNLNDVDEYDFGGEYYNHDGFYVLDSEWGYSEIPYVVAWMEIEPYEG